MRAEVGEAQGLRVVDDFPEQAVAGRQGADLGDLLLGESDREELRERPSVRADDAQRAVLGVDQQRGGLHDPPEHLGEIQLPSDRHDGLQQAVHPVAGTPHRVDAHMEFVEQLVQPHPRHLSQRIPHTHALPLRLPVPSPGGQRIDTPRTGGTSLRADACRD
ncbi:hypothetical protein SAVIM40S_00044 [Streptomyces avidinii]